MEVYSGIRRLCQVSNQAEYGITHQVRRIIMGPISGVNDRQTNPYLQWQEKIVNKTAGKPEESKTEAKSRTIEAQGVKEAGDGKTPGSARKAEAVPARRTRDEYIPESVSMPDADKSPAADQASKNGEGRKPEVCKASTDKVDREIEKLKKRKEELESQLRTEKDEGKLQKLKRELAQVERELSQKDNDTYRRQHMEVTRM